MPILIDKTQLDLLFPAYIRTDSDLVITDVGPSVARHSVEVRPGRPLLDVFDCVRPSGPFDPKTCARDQRSIHIQSHDRALNLRGIIAANTQGYVLFVGHAPGAEDRLGRLSLRMSDFSPADASLDALMAVELQRALLQETQELARSLTMARDEARAANKAKSEFLANVSHEIRTPLHGVIGVTGALAATELSPLQAEMVDLIHNSGETLTRVINDILDYSRLEAGALTIVNRPFEPGPLLMELAHLFEPMARQRGLDIRASISDTLRRTCLGDTDRLKQVVSNVLSNAVKFTDHGSVELRAALDERDDADWLVVDVIDTGRGVSAQDQDRIFQRFLQADGSMTREVGGSGLGLAICRSLLEAMGGTIRLVSAVGHGSSFTIELPLRNSAVAQVSGMGEADANLSGGGDLATVRRRFLVAEDDAANRRIIELMLAPLGCEIVLANNGAEAVRAFRDGGWDIVLLDMQMPVMDGMSAALAMRQTERELGWPRTPIAMLSANVLPRHVERALLAGADHFIGKPVTPAALSMGLEKLLEMNANHRASALTH